MFAFYGVKILKLQGAKDIVQFDSKLPITALNMIPRAVEQIFRPGLARSESYSDIIMGRYVSLLISVLLALLIYHWSDLLYGRSAAACSFVIFLICPNFLAHGIFVSSDIFASLFMAGVFYFLWKFSKSAQTSDFLYASFCVALAQISKFSMIHLFILFPLLLITGYCSGAGIFKVQKFSAGKIIRLLFIFTGINWLVISGAHLFYGMFIPLNNYHFRSGAFQHLQQLLHGLGDYLFIPLPASYIESLDMVIYLDKLGAGMPGSSQGAFYILGNSSGHGFWYYYFAALWYKLPLSLWLTLAIGFTWYFKKWNWHLFVQAEMYLLVPVLYFLVYMSFFYSTQIGIRHIVIILPLLYIFVGFLFKQIAVTRARYFFYGLLVYQCISVGLYFPHFLPYTNELIMDKKMAYKKIADTNLCYGEGGKFLLEYLHQHPDAHYLPKSISSGKIVMEVNEMLNIDITAAGKYDWVRGLAPSDHIHSQYLIFDVSPAAADSLKEKYTKQY